MQCILCVQHNNQMLSELREDLVKQYRRMNNQTLLITITHTDCSFIINILDFYSRLESSEVILICTFSVFALFIRYKVIQSNVASEGKIRL